MKQANIHRTYKYIPGIWRYRFNLIAANGQIIASSERYTQKHNCIEVLKENFPDFVIVDETRLK